MHLQRIKGNIKGGIPNYINLSPKTVIWGENGSGKSTITNAIELVCGGFASDVMGREVVRKPSDLIVLKGLGLPKQTLKIQGELSNGSHLMYELRKTEKGAGRPRHQGPQGLVVKFPFQEVKENLTGSADKAKAWLSSNLPIDKYLQVSPQLRDQINYYRDTNPNAPLSEILDTIQEVHKRRIKEAKTEIKACEMTKEMLGKDFAPLEEYVVKQAEERANEFLQQIMSMGKAIQKQDVEVAMEQLIKLQKEAESVRLELQSLQGVQGVSESERKEIETLEHLYHVLVLDQQYQNCYVCNSPKTGKRIQPQQVLDLLEQVKSRQQASQKRTDLEVNLARLTTEFTTQQAKYNSLAQAFDVQQRYDVDIHHKYNQAVKEHESLKTKYKNFEQVKDLNSKMEVLKKSIEEDTLLVEQAAQQSSDAIQQAIEVFCQSVTQFLPQQYEFIMELTNNYCRIGMLKYGTKCFAVSGAEWVSMVLAIASATTENDPNCLSIFIPEERAFDQESFQHLMLALQNVQGQVILTSTHCPPSIEGWTNVHCTYIPF